MEWRKSSAMKFLFGISALLFAISVSSLQAQPSTGADSSSASPPIPPLPAPTIAPPLPEKSGPSATLTFAGTAPLQARSRSGTFRLIGIRPREAVDIKLQFSNEWVGTPLV